MTETPELDPEELAQWEWAAPAHEAEMRKREAEERAKRRRARDRYYFLQGLATGIAGTVILGVVAWGLWP